MSHTSIRRVAAVLAFVGALACADSTRPTEAAPPVDGPSLTVSSGVTNLTLVRANAGVIGVHSKFLDFKSKLSTDENADVVVNDNSMAAGGTSGWHTHPGMTVIAIKSGALTFYDGDDPNCRPTVYAAGQVAVESGGHVHVARNEGSIPAQWYTTYIVPAGGPTRVDAAAPGTVRSRARGAV